MKIVVMCLGLSCLLLGSLPTIWYPITLRPGWYCTVTVQHVVNGTLHTQVCNTMNAIVAFNLRKTCVWSSQGHLMIISRTIRLLLTELLNFS